jgi:DNA-binding PadR family transcriptional regulator
VSGQNDQPLSPLTMAILLAVAKEEQHGYALMKEVEEQTGGALRPGTGSLYAALQRLLDEGLITETQGSGAREDPRRKYFRITTAGRAAARAEATRMMGVIRIAREKSVIRDYRMLEDTQ